MTVDVDIGQEPPHLIVHRIFRPAYVSVLYRQSMRILVASELLQVFGEVCVVIYVAISLCQLGLSTHELLALFLLELLDSHEVAHVLIALVRVFQCAVDLVAQNEELCLVDALLIALVLQDLVQALRVTLAKQLIKLLIQVYDALLLWWLATNLLLLHALETQEILEAKVIDLIGFTATLFKCFNLLSLNLTTSTISVTAAFLVAVTGLFL